MDTVSLWLFTEPNSPRLVVSNEELIALLKRRRAVMEEVARLNGLNPTFVYHEELEAP